MTFRWRRISLRNWIKALADPDSSMRLSHQPPSLAGCMGNHYVVSKSELLLRIKPVWKHELHYRLMQNESQWLHPWKSQLIQHLLYPVYLKLFLYPTHVHRNYMLHKVYQICQNLLTYYQLLENFYLSDRCIGIHTFHHLMANRVLTQQVC